MGTFGVPKPETTPRSGWVALLRDLVEHFRGYGRDLGGLAALELQQGAKSLRQLAVLAAAGALVLLVSFLVLTFALVGAVAYGLDSWRWALLVVGVAYVLVGGGMLAAVVRGARKNPLRLEHTRRRLKEDAQYLKNKFAA